MKVSDSRKIHIMAFPQDTFLKARWSDDQSAAMPRRPPGLSCVTVRAVSAIPQVPSGKQLAADIDESRGPAGQQHEQAEPDEQQEVPVHGAKLDIAAQPVGSPVGPGRGHRGAEPDEAARYVEPVQAGQHVEEAV